MTTERFVYKKNVSTNKFIKVGVVDKCGFVDFYDTDKEIYLNSLGLYYPEFYTDYEIEREITGQKTIRNVEGEVVGKQTISVGKYISSINKKAFVPKNLPQQVVARISSIFLKPEEYYVTGYVTEGGRVYYYDQFVKEKGI